MLFSHKSFIHLAFNMIALSSFGELFEPMGGNISAESKLGSTVFLWLEKSQSESRSRMQESSAQYHFAAYFLSGA